MNAEQSTRQPAPAGLLIARNVAAALGAVALVAGLLMQGASVLLWIGAVLLAAAAGIALVTTSWRSMSIGTRVIVAVCLVVVAVVVFDAVT